MKIWGSDSTSTLLERNIRDLNISPKHTKESSKSSDNGSRGTPKESLDIVGKKGKLMTFTDQSDEPNLHREVDIELQYFGEHLKR